MTEPSVNDIADAELLRRVISECRRGRGRHKIYLWSKISAQFALGSGYSMQLCRRFGFDPDEMVKDR